MISRTYYWHETTVLIKGGKPVARIVPAATASITGRELASLWADLPHLDSSDAEAMGRDIDSASKALSAPRDPA